ncbi:hypothetical protein [Marinomonas transparens]|uniref:Late embryogenesis abundant protein n=1 Tax=Marinomonas transparens TaxID=2795388 RepID=A0A934JQI2_9GAMM|nr:hypothetical protein [Marinomonas transparens]MBJ7538214.1 hypothetical protein [Marinomonas transparens]
MQYMKLLIGSLILISSLLYAEESAVDKTKDSAVELWKNAKEATVELVGKASEKASAVGEKASETGSKASSNVKATGIIVWDVLKEAGAATAQSAKKGMEKIRQLGDEKSDKEKCNEDHAPCYKGKE